MRLAKIISEIAGLLKSNDTSQTTLTPAVDATGGTNGNNVSSVTWTHTTGSGLSNSIVIVAVANSGPSGGTNFPTGVTYNGSAMTALSGASGSTTSSTSRTMTLYYLLNPAPGANTIVATFNTSTAINIACDSISLYNVDQTTPFGTPAVGNNASASSLSASVSSLTTDLVLSAIVVRNNNPTGGSGQIMRVTNAFGTSTYAVVDTQAGTGSTVSPSFTWSSADNAVEVAVAVHGASATKLTPVVDTAAGSSGTGTTLAWTHTVNAGLGSSALVVLVGNSSPGAGTSFPTGVTYGTNTLTQNSSVGSSSSTSRVGSIYVLANPPAGADTVTVTFNNSVKASCGSISVANVDPSGLFGTFASASSTSTTSPTVSTTSLSNDLILSMLVSRNGSGTGASGQSLRVSNSYPAGTKIEALSDDFSTQNTVMWNGYGTGVTATGGQLQIVPAPTYRGLTTNVTGDLTASSCVVELVQRANQGGGTIETQMVLKDSSGNELSMLVSGTNLTFREKVSGSPSDTAVTYNATTHLWWRIRESVGTVYWETSPDGTTWTTQRSKSTTVVLTALTAQLQSGYYGTETGVGTAIFDNFNPPDSIVTVVNTQPGIIGLVSSAYSLSSGGDSALIALPIHGGGTITASPPVFDASSAQNGNNVSSITWNHTVGANLSNMVLVVAVGNSGTGTGTVFANSVTYNGAAMSQLAQAQSTSSTNRVVTFFVLKNPPSGTHQVAVTMNGSFDSVGCTAESFSNVDQTTPFGTPGTNQSNSATSLSTSVTNTGTTDLNLAAIVVRNNAPTAGTGLTSRQSSNDSTFTYVNAATAAGLAGTVSIPYTWSGADNAALIAVPMHGVGATSGGGSGSGGGGGSSGGTTNTANGAPLTIGNFTRIFFDDFDSPVTAGNMINSSGQGIGVYAGKWGAYSTGTTDTAANNLGTNSGYSNAILSVSNSAMVMDLHKDSSGRDLGAAPYPILDPSLSGYSYNDCTTLYGRREVRFQCLSPIQGFKTAWLGWAKAYDLHTATWPSLGEQDDVEGSVNGTIATNMHWNGASNGGQQDSADSDKTYTSWHTHIAEWSPGDYKCYLDGVLYFHSTGAHVSNTPFRYIMQTESVISTSGRPITGQHCSLAVDFVAIYKYNG